MGANRAFTNWDEALQAVANAETAGTHYDLVLMITDGAPNYSRSHQDTSDVQFHSVENAVLSANAVKAAGTRMVGMGVGAGIGNPSAAINLAAISGPTENTDYFLSGSWADLSVKLKALTQGLTCQVPVVVTKHITDIGGNNPALDSGWTMTAQNGAVTGGSATLTPLGSSTPANPSSLVTGASPNTVGSAEWTLKFSDPNASTSVTVTENSASKANYTPKTLTCTVTHKTGSPTVYPPAAVTTLTMSGINSTDQISCDFVNQLTPVSVRLQKAWVNGSNGDTTALTINGANTKTSTSNGTVGTQTDTANVSTASVAPGSTVSLAEVLGASNVGAYSVSGFTCTGATISWTSGAKTATFTAPASGAVTCTVTNTRTTSSVTFQKAWVGGASGDTSALSINGATVSPGLATSTSNGTVGTQIDTTNTATASVPSGSTVSLAEVLGASNVGAYAVSGFTCTGATISWTSGAKTATFTAPASGSVTCTITNARQKSDVSKSVTVNGALRRQRPGEAG